MRMRSQKKNTGSKRRGSRTTKKRPLPPPPSPEWDHSVDEGELGRIGSSRAYEEDRAKGFLISMLYGRASQLGHSRVQLAEYLGVSYAYLAQLSAGYRPIQNVSEEFKDRAGRYLGVPRISILRAMNVVTERDYYEKPEDLLWGIPGALRSISEDPNVREVFPYRFFRDSAPAEAQFCIIRFYEMATGRQLLGKRANMREVHRFFAKLEKRRAEILKRIRRHA
ncbi:MAG: hypothetical protein RB191_21075 [Terriglobia bacterium]|nr:hypothetical protein [Terriglobia bacterium]